jgi:hypothetical protein
MPSLVERYRQGDHVAVWDELRALGSLGSAPAALRAEVAEVARLTMERAAVNVDTLFGRLTEMGYTFCCAEPRTRPGPESVAIRAFLRQHVGAIPDSFDAWLSHVGNISFRGILSSWHGSQPWEGELFDPLECALSREQVADELEHARELHEEDFPGAPLTEFPLPFAGDFFHKNNISGGAASEIILPSDHADARITEDNGGRYTDYHDGLPGDESGIWFVDYLRRYFGNGGFRRVRRDHPYPTSFFEDLAEGLLPI